MTNKQVYQYYYRVVFDRLGRKPKNSEVITRISQVVKKDERTVRRWYAVNVLPYGAQALIELDTNSELEMKK